MVRTAACLLLLVTLVPVGAATQERAFPTTIDEYLTALVGGFGEGAAPETPNGTSRVEIFGRDGAVETVTVVTDPDDQPDPTNRAFHQELLLSGSRRLQALYLRPLIVGEIELAERTLQSEPDGADRWRRRLVALREIAQEIETVLAEP